jgi:hypothetical protein
MHPLGTNPQGAVAGGPPNRLALVTKSLHRFASPFVAMKRRLPAAFQDKRIISKRKPISSVNSRPGDAPRVIWVKRRARERHL